MRLSDTIKFEHLRDVKSGSEMMMVKQDDDEDDDDDGASKCVTLCLLFLICRLRRMCFLVGAAIEFSYTLLSCKDR